MAEAAVKTLRHVVFFAVPEDSKLSPKTLTERALLLKSIAGVSNFGFGKNLTPRGKEFNYMLSMDFLTGMPGHDFYAMHEVHRAFVSEIILAHGIAVIVQDIELE